MNDEKNLTILDHLGELRRRLINSVIAVLITTVISFVFARQLFYVLIRPAGNVNLIYTEMTEMITVYMKVSLAAGLALAMPYIIYQVVMFIAPALTSREKKYVYLILPWVTLMFLVGIAFAYFVLIPPAVRFLITFGSDIATAQIKIGNYISVVTRLLIAVGLVFEMPVVTTFLARIGIVKPGWLARKRKAAVIFAFILAAFITPTFDPINQTLVAVPLIVLYEISILLARMVDRERKKEIKIPTFWLYFIGVLSLAGTALGLATGYLDAQILNISKNTGQVLLNVSGIMLIIDIMAALVLRRFRKGPTLE